MIVTLLANDDEISIVVRTTDFGACTATLSRIHDISSLNLCLPQSDGEWFFFNRIFVHRSERNKGYGSKAMRMLAFIADEQRVNIVNPMNPYGDLNATQLEQWFKKFGFEKIEDGVVVRLHK